MTIPVPSQEKLHKKWCLFDQIVNIDFDREVRKITHAAAEETLHDEVNKDDRRSSAISGEETENFKYQSNLLDSTFPVKRDLKSNKNVPQILLSANDLENNIKKKKKLSEISGRESDKITSQLSLLDVHCSVRGDLPSHENLPQIGMSLNRVNDPEDISQRKRQTFKKGITATEYGDSESLKSLNQRVTSNVRIVRMTKEVSINRH